MPTNNPAAVVISACETPLASFIVFAPTKDPPERVSNDSIIPSTVPSNPTMGAMAPMSAR